MRIYRSVLFIEHDNQELCLGERVYVTHGWHIHLRSPFHIIRYSDEVFWKNGKCYSKIKRHFILRKPFFFIRVLRQAEIGDSGLKIGDKVKRDKNFKDMLYIIKKS